MSALTERRDRIATLLRSAREKHNVSQRDMAKLLYVSRATVINWETGICLPDVAMFFEWFEVLNEPIGKWIGELMYPDSHTNKDTLLARNTVCDIVMNHLTDIEAEEVRFLLSSEYGSRYGYVQLCIANLQCPLGDRQQVAHIISENYKDAVELGQVTFPDEVQPDIEMLDKAVSAGRTAYRNGSNTYTITHK